MDIEAIRLECLKMALASNDCYALEQVIKDAKQMMTFIKIGKSEPPRNHGQES